MFFSTTALIVTSVVLVLMGRGDIVLLFWLLVGVGSCFAAIF